MNCIPHNNMNHAVLRYVACLVRATSNAIFIAGAIICLSCNGDSSSTVQPEHTSTTQAAASPVIENDLPAIRKLFPPHVPIPDGMKDLFARQSRYGFRGYYLSFRWDEPFPASRLSTWYVNEAKNNGWRRLEYDLEMPGTECCAENKWGECGQGQDAGMKWNCWWVNEKKESLWISIYYFKQSLDTFARVLVEYRSSCPLLDKYFARYESMRGKLYVAEHAIDDHNATTKPTDD